MYMLKMEEKDVLMGNGEDGQMLVGWKREEKKEKNFGWSERKRKKKKNSLVLIG